MGQVRVAIAGAGGMAQAHLEALSQCNDVEIVAICNRGNPRIDELTKRFDIPKVFTDCQNMLETTSPDAVVVAVSILSTEDVAAVCLRRGMPTLIEKPAGLSCAATTSLLAAAEESKALHMVGLNRRFYSVVRRAREAILERGPTVSIVVEAPEGFARVKGLGVHPPEVLQRWVVANGIHCIDLLRFFGGEVEQVHSSAGQWFENQNDSFGALIRFANGAVGHYISNWMSPGGWSVTLYGRGRRVTLAPLERGVVQDSDGTEFALEVDEADTRLKPGLYAQDRYFVDCVKMGRPPAYPAADLSDVLKTMQLVDAIMSQKSV